MIGSSYVLVKTDDCHVGVSCDNLHVQPASPQKKKNTSKVENKIMLMDINILSKGKVHVHACYVLVM